MKIHSLAVKNFKIHRESRVEFDDRVTLLAGPNETGKSTLLEALEKAFFLRARGTSAEHKNIRTRLHTGHPEVEVVFSAGGHTYSLKKCFSGANGTSRLQLQGGDTWSGDDVDTELARILRVDSAMRLGNQWAHLLIKQGASGANPTDSAQAQSTRLLQRLQSRGGAASLLVSPRDEQVAARFRSAVESMFNQGGRPKVGSDLAKAEAAQESAKRELEAARTRHEDLLEAAQQHESATRILQEKTQSLQNLKPRLEQARQSLEEAKRLETELGSLRIQAQTASTEAERLAKAEQTIAETRARIEETQKTLTPLDDNCKRVEATLEAARQTVQSREDGYSDASKSEADAQLVQQFAKAQLSVFEKTAEAETLRESRRMVLEIRQKISDLEQRLASLPEIEADDLVELEEAEQELAAARAALEATATKVVVEACESPVEIAGEKLAAGASRVVFEPTEISIGTTRLKLVPGGVSGLDSARDKARQAEERLRSLLAKHGVEKSAEARKLAGERQIAKTRLADLQKNLKAAKAEKIEAALKTAESEIARATTALASIAPKCPTLAAPADLLEARRFLEDAEDLVSKSQSAKTAADTARTDARIELNAAQTALDLAKSVRRDAEKNLLEAQARLAAHIGEFGNDLPREEFLAAAKLAAESANRAWTSATTRFEEMQIAELCRTEERLAKSLDRDSAAIQEARTQQAVAATKLGRDGESDPVANLKRAEILHESATKALDGIRRKTAAIQLVDHLFQEQRSQLAEECTRPFVEKITAYLRCLFGPRVKAAINLEDGQFAGIEIARPDFGDVSFDFQELSGGAAEQVATAARLAMAQILAEEHDGSLPVVFDDAFTNSDSDRVLKIQSMLDLAAENGLQVIVLSCNSADYSGSGAKEIPLEPRRFAGPTTSFAEESPVGNPETPTNSPSPAVNPGDMEKFLTALREAGGKSGNAALQATLGWDDGTYTAVKENLLTSGQITKGQGRGGSVSLV